MLRFTISQKLFLLASITLVAFVISQGYSLLVERGNTVRLQDMDQRLYPTLELTAANLSSLLLMEQQISNAVTTGDDQALDATEKHYQRIRSNLEALSGHSDRASGRSAQIDRQLQDWYGAARRIAGAFLSGNVDFSRISADAKANAERLQALRASLEAMKSETETALTEAIRATMTDSQRANRTTLLIAILAMICLVIVSTIIGRSITASLLQVSRSLKIMASGKGDLTTRIDYAGHDEIRELVDSFNEFIDKLHLSFADVSRDVTSLNEVATRLTQASGSNLQQISTQADAINFTRDLLEELVSSVREVAQHATDASDQAKAARDAAAAGYAGSLENAQTINALADEVKSAAEIVQRFEGFSSDVGSLLNTIQTVAEQTNLLALNAAIEAARAGEHGRGFAVVADEVRGLAVRTRQATEEIHSVIEELRQVSGNAVGAMQSSVTRASTGVQATLASGETLNTILSNVENISNLNIQIAAATHQQTQTFAVVSERVSGIDNNTAEVIKSTHELDGVSRDIDRISQGLHRISSQFRV